MKKYKKVKFIERFRGLIEILKKKQSLIPKVQIDELEYNPIINPPLSPKPQEWWVNSFDWYVAIELVSGARYGPFYRIDGEHFWPQIGDPSSTYSENNCFFGLEKPKNIQDAEEKYKLQKDTSTQYTHEFIIDCSNLSPSERAFIFIGPVKDGTGFQMNPNMVTGNIIKLSIIKGNIKREKLLNKDSSSPLTHLE